MPVLVGTIVITLVLFILVSMSFFLLSIFWTLGVGPNCHWCDKGGTQEK